ncbi:MAG: Type 1 glutamine amidotransferase-like domain-containing protein [Bacteroidales bacterium]|jgi:dipeptidase E|nr:Type 1 glutamine amidotransferase-like domain-containing protein [Bacteroidales bacterium]
MNLVFCSKLNKKIDKIITSFSNNENFSIGYIPSATNPDNKHFKQIEQHYAKKYGINNILCLDIDKKYDKRNFYKNLKKCCILILSGGNTEFFLKKIKERKLKEAIIKFVKNKNNLLIGISAGGIIMTNNINTSNILNKESVKNKKGLGLVNFEFFPHYKNLYKKPIQKYSSKITRKIFICSENEILFINKKNENMNNYYYRGKFYEKK